jgi:hypothetical protein
MLLFQDQTPLSSSPLVENNPAAETREGRTQALSEEIQARLNKIFAWLQKDARDQIRDLDYFEGMLEPISQNSLRTSRLHWNPSLVWIFIMWP